MGHEHAHGHGHAHFHESMGDRRVFVAILINLALTLLQIVGGLLSGSLALVADAVHNLSDALSLIIAFAARRIARAPSDRGMTFGYGRAEIIAALINYTSLILIGIYLVYEAVLRLWVPNQIEGWIVVWVAGAALLVDSFTALLTWSMARDSLNIRAAFLHNLADALGSVAVIIAGSLVILFDWHWVDPLITLMIAAWILQLAFSHIGPVIRILMQGTPLHLDVEVISDALAEIPGVIGVHHVHVWQFTERRSSLEAHLVIDDDAPESSHDIVARATRLARRHFGIEHTTFQVEPVHRRCHDDDMSPGCY